METARHPWWRPVLAAMGLAVSTGGCEPKPINPDDQSSPSDEASPDGDEESDDDEGGASPFGGMSPMAKLFTSGLQKPGPYDELEKSEDFAEDAAHWVTLELDKPIAELETISLFAMAPATPLRSIEKKLDEAAKNDKVQGVVVRSNDLLVDMATAQDLRDVLIDFKADGKRKVVCHTETAINAAYYVLTACDRIGLAPLGDIIVPGPAATPVHVKGLLDRLGVQADFLHVGAFKGAAEPLTRDAPSPEMIETLEAIVEQSYATMLAGLEQSRGLDHEAAVAAVDRALYVGDEAVEAKLVDEVATWESFRDSATGGQPWKKLKSGKNPLQDFGAIQRFLGMSAPERPDGPHVALVYAVGNIIDGKGQGILGSRQEIASRTLVAALRALHRDEDVKAVVLRIDSGGGSALASEQIWTAAAELGKTKPLVVSMGSVAASGGYYISAGAKKIYARENTLTGSIGVVGGKVVLGGALEKVGVKTYAVKRGERAMMWSMMDPWTDAERDAVRGMMEATYETFLSRVGAGRDMDRDAVHAIAQGRVWTGVDAKANGLVDELGGLDAALADAHQMAGLQPGGELQVYPPEPTLRDILSSFGQVQVSPFSAALDELAATAAGVGAPELDAVRRILRTLADLRDARVWAVSWIRPPR